MLDLSKIFKQTLAFQCQLSNINVRLVGMSDLNCADWFKNF